jgi:hypothetical protein
MQNTSKTPMLSDGVRSAIDHRRIALHREILRTLERQPNGPPSTMKRLDVLRREYRAPEPYVFTTFERCLDAALSLRKAFCEYSEETGVRLHAESDYNDEGGTYYYVSARSDSGAEGIEDFLRDQIDGDWLSDNIGSGEIAFTRDECSEHRPLKDFVLEIARKTNSASFVAQFFNGPSDLIYEPLEQRGEQEALA